MMFRRTPQSEKRQEIAGMSGRTFLYHAHGLALGGTITQPFKAEIESHAATSLPIIGGFASAKMENYRLREIVSYRSAHSYVSGIQTDDGTHTVASCTIEGLNILDVITADAIVGRLSSKHADSGQPEIITLGSSFVNLKIAGQPVQVDLDNDLFTAHPTYDKLVTYLDPQGKQGKGGAKAKPPAKVRYAWGQSNDQPSQQLEKGMLIPTGADSHLANGVLHTSLVKQVRPVGSNNSAEELPYAYAIQIPHVGRVYLGELFVSADSKRLTMLRVELGSPVVAVLAAAAPTTNGSWFP
jgi:hypothetical protein